LRALKRAQTAQRTTPDVGALRKKKQHILLNGPLIMMTDISVHLESVGFILFTDTLYCIDLSLSVKPVTHTH